ncbi:MAG: glycosyltransferase family 9 protein [Pseudobdellovibrionaceae bacterium]
MGKNEIQTNCRHFNGYKPCGKAQNCNSLCGHFDEIQNSLLIVHLGALGAVIRSTALLAPIKRKFPKSKITWVTDAPAHHLLKDHPLIDKVLTTSMEDMLSLSCYEFEAAFVIDKGAKAVGVLKQTRADLMYGFQINVKTQSVEPATEAARELWTLGLDNHKKFFVNKKTELQLIHEALELGPYFRDDYYVPLTAKEQKEVQARRKGWLRSDKIILGINTGCANVIPYKKLSIDFHRELIQDLARTGKYQIVLLGGPEDKVRNEKIAYGLPVIQSATNQGLRDGLISVDACDLILTGDSLGMHMAIARKKWVVAWFGPTCDHEIELFDRGVAIKSQAPCSPCWKRSCSKTTMCYDLVAKEEIYQALTRGENWHRSQSENTLFSKPLSLATCY